ncbi:type I restriction enzyme HsdR N-terminal domain-containing protein [Peribacillus frigoritolerans]|uniref:type I restriction enzyme HsdR N-terminal domain-containing protein n=1 Tax=Peribacillus frigoritolerans TaxID=450367 RepID=UPI00227E2D11|nr:type I restriction enzyme HsdR N-terminal domain-containing protein [Peribacillus frigoritolerans]MCY9003277.1 type I restriction enzyme HsdR N-terminal domain-containing protein [Peribacillus frigoritolerans]
MNEEQVKNSIIVPYLKQLGFTTDEIIYEKNLKIMIPRKGTIQVEKNKKNVFADIIVQRKIGDVYENIFLVEVKRSGHKINQTDIEQGLCYARLLEQMPPFVVITNGNETKVLETISQLEIKDIKQSEYYLSGNQITIGEDLRREALRTFINMDSSNLVEYCKLITKANLKDIYSEDKTSKSIVGSVHYDRKKYINDFKKFISGDKTTYAFVGKSGIGKTNILYSIIKKYRDNYPILFYNSGLLNESLQKSIVQDFNFLYRREYKFNDVIDRINNICKTLNKKLFIIIDGLDESNDKQYLKQEINSLAKKVYNSNIALILTCKTNDEVKDIWYEFTHHKGTENFLGQTVYNSLTFHMNDKLGTYVDKLDEMEIKMLWKKYKSKFKIRGELKEQSKELAKIPFLMRIISETYQGKSIEMNLNEIKLYSQWLNKKYEQSTDEDMLRIILKRIVIRMVELGSDTISYDDLIEELITVPDITSLIKEAINLGILNSISNINDPKYVSFYNENILFYFYSVVVKGWDKKNIDELYKFFNDLGNDNFYWRIINFFICNVQKNYEANNELWNSHTSPEEVNICEICNESLEINDLISLICDLSFEENTNKGSRAFSLAHKTCIPKNFPLELINKRILRCSSSDLLAIDNVFSFLKYTPEEKINSIDREINDALKARREKIKSYYPKRTTKGEPFWALMEFHGDINLGNIFNKKDSNNNPVAVLFRDKKTASNTLRLLRNNGTLDDIKYEVVGLDKKYIEAIFKFNHSKEINFLVVQGLDNQGNGVLIEMSLEEIYTVCINYKNIINN